MSSSSDSEDGFNINKFRESVDTNFISDSMFKQIGNEQSNTSTPILKAVALEAPRSQRHLPVSEEQHNDIDILVPESMQNFVHKKLSQIIDKKTEFIEICSNNSHSKLKRNEIISNVRLLRDSDKCINLNVPKIKVLKQQKPIIKRRPIESEAIKDHKDRLQECIITIDDIHNETKNWKCKKTSSKRLWEYRYKNGSFYLNETKTEFTKLRKKNNWTEVPGHIFRGKRRLVKEVKLSAMNSLIRDYEQTERNMFYLRHPYLTPEESSGHTKEIKKREALIQKWNDAILATKMKPHVTIEERLNHLRIKDVWE